MTISTYADLQSALTNWLGGRTDLTTYYPDWITLFEAHAARKLRLRRMEATATLSPSSGSASLPTDYLGWRHLYWNGSNLVELEYVHPSWLAIQYPSTPSGTPAVFTIEGSTLKIMPVSDTTLTLDYYAKNSAVSSSLNWLFQNFPDAYLFGALAEAGGFVLDTDSLALWKARRDEVMQEVSTLFFREQGPMRIRVADAVP